MKKAEAIAERKESTTGLEELEVVDNIDLLEEKEELEEEGNEIQINIPKPEREVSYKETKNSKTVAIYPYRNINDTVLYEVVRRTGRGQPYLTRYKNEKGEEIYKLPEDIDLVIYNLPNVRKSIEEERVIWITEGESKADTLNSLGFTATTCAFSGSKKWGNYYNKYLEGANTVLIMVDNDEKSEEFAENTVQTITSENEAISVYRIRLNEICSSLKIGGDIDDLIELIGKERTTNTLKTIEANY